MTHEEALIELAAAVTRLSGCVESTSQLLNTLCEQLAAEDGPLAARPRTLTLRLIEGGRPTT